MPKLGEEEEVAPSEVRGIVFKDDTATEGVRNGLKPNAPPVVPIGVEGGEEEGNTRVGEEEEVLLLLGKNEIVFVVEGEGGGIGSDENSVNINDEDTSAYNDEVIMPLEPEGIEEDDDARLLLFVSLIRFPGDPWAEEDGPEEGTENKRR